MRRYIAMIMLAALGLCGCTTAASEAPAPAKAAKGVKTLAAPALPEQQPYPDETAYYDEKGFLDSDSYFAAWEAWREGQAQRGTAETAALNAFTRSAAVQLLTGEEGENRLISPLNLYLALGMLAEVTGGESRQQLLELLEQENIEALRENADALWTAHYRDDGIAVSRLAGSFWLRPDMDYNTDTLHRLSELYRAAAFEGIMGSPETNEALQTWINEQTGGLLEKQAGDLCLSEDTVMALVSTIYYSARWSSTFAPESTEPGVFHAPAGEQDCEYMKRSAAMGYGWGEHFGAVALGLEEGSMELILPDEGVTAEELLREDEFWAYALRTQGWEQQKHLTVHLALPKFDVSCELDLTESLKAMGVRDVFDAEQADFSPLCTAEGLLLSQARHAARVKADEEGVEAAAYTVMAVAGMSMPPAEEVDFTLDRPFVFLLRGADGAALFVGVVNDPVL